jgi:ribonuclease BN (tRNA processing enzyme)
MAPMMCSAVAGDGSLDTRIQLAQSSGEPSNSRTRLILLGTAGGPTWWPNSDQCGISSVVAVGDAYYIVDCGEGVGKRLQQAISPASSRVMDDKVRALFLTHLHSDHTVDYANLLLFGLFVGLDRRSSPFKVFGPGRRGQMAPVFALPGSPPPTVPIINPDNPTPGTQDMTGYLYQAFATDLNDRIRDNGKPSLEAVVEVRDIEIPPIAGFKSPNETPSPPMEPFKFFEDDRVRVSATLVEHAPAWPSFAYRFDTDDGSIVFSGDTGRSENLIKLAKGADILVHCDELGQRSLSDAAYDRQRRPDATSAQCPHPGRRGRSNRGSGRRQEAGAQPHCSRQCHARTTVARGQGILRRIGDWPGPDADRRRPGDSGGSQGIKFGMSVWGHSRRF